MSGVYTKLSGAKVPWTCLEKERAVFIADKYLPDGITLRDPEHMQEEEIKRLMRWWRDRQFDPRIRTVLRFHAWKSRSGAAEALGPNGVEVRPEGVRRRRRTKSGAAAMAHIEHRGTPSPRCHISDN